MAASEPNSGSAKLMVEYKELLELVNQAIIRLATVVDKEEMDPHYPQAGSVKRIINGIVGCIPDDAKDIVNIQKFTDQEKQADEKLDRQVNTNSYDLSPLPDIEVDSSKGLSGLSRWEHILYATDYLNQLRNTLLDVLERLAKLKADIQSPEPESDLMKIRKSNMELFDRVRLNLVEQLSALENAGYLFPKAPDILRHPSEFKDYLDVEVLCEWILKSPSYDEISDRLNNNIDSFEQRMQDSVEQALPENLRKKKLSPSEEKAEQIKADVMKVIEIVNEEKTLLTAEKSRGGLFGFWNAKDPKTKVALIDGALARATSALEKILIESKNDRQITIDSFLNFKASKDQPSVIEALQGTKGFKRSSLAENVQVKLNNHFHSNDDYLHKKKR